MFDRLFDFIADVWEWVIFWTVVDSYEQGVILRFGKFKRIINPGLRFMLPFGIDSPRTETVVRQTAYLDVQSLTSFDGKAVAISGIVIFRITDIRKFLLDIDEGETDMTNIVYGIITDWVEETNWADVRGPAFNSDVLRTARAECNEYCGVEVLAIKWSDKTVARGIRLWND